MLTRPNVMVPDQNGRALGSCCCSWASSGTDLVSFRFLSTRQGRETLRKLIFDRRARGTRLQCWKTWPLPLGFCFDEFHQPVAILVAELLGIKSTFKRRDQFFGHPQFLRVERSAARCRQL